MSDESQDVRGVCSNNRRCSLTILDNVLTTGESEEGEEVAGWPHPGPGDLQEGVGEGGCEKSHGARLPGDISTVVLVQRKMCQR
jgi:hypothetical protein